MKRIKKVSQTVPTSAQVVDGYSNSTTDSYSCNYVNELVEKESLSTNIINEITPSVGENYAGYGGCYYYKVGARVHIHIGYHNSTASSDNQIFTLSEEYRPYTGIIVKGGGGDYKQTSSLYITPSGNIKVQVDQYGYACADAEYDIFTQE